MGICVLLFQVYATSRSESLPVSALHPLIVHPFRSWAVLTCEVLDLLGLPAGFRPVVPLYTLARESFDKGPSLSKDCQSFHCAAKCF